ncbi:tail fiber assembly protein, partial [Serratia marcescens]|uniref:tail fiber assembly protein n=1 Tax=Serratia marcescens TaxID=615 RepID=UPI003D36B3C3
MSYGFSASTGAFYVYEDRASYEENGNWPADVKPVSEDVWQAYCGQGPAGKVRGADRKGLPCWVDALPPTKSMLVAAAERKKAELLDVAGKV